MRINQNLHISGSPKGAQNMFSRVRAHIASRLIQEMPVEMDACFNCKALHCDAANFRTCSMRLGRLAEVTGARPRAPFTSNTATAGANQSDRVLTWRLKWRKAQ